MKIQMHYIVVFDTETKTWSVDWETGEAKLYDGEVYDKESGQWSVARLNEELNAYYEDYGGKLDAHLVGLDLPQIVIAPTLGDEVLNDERTPHA